MKVRAPWEGGANGERREARRERELELGSGERPGAGVSGAGCTRYSDRSGGGN